MAADLLHFTLILVLTTGIVLLLQLLRQPPVIGYILAGIVVGPAVFNWAVEASFLETFSSIGIALLLFLVGISLDVRAVRHVGVVSLVTGLGQVAFTSAAGFLMALAFGFSPLTSIYIAVALTFSSTIIIVKLLSDKKDLDSLYGRISVGFLVVQDIIAVLSMVLISTFGDAGGDVVSALSGFLLKALLIGLLLWGLHVFVLKRLVRAAGAHQETLFLYSITLCFALAVAFGVAGLSLEIGALVAGLLLASTPYSHEIASRIKPLRDFFIILFFILLGSQMQLSALHGLILPAILFSIFVLIGNPAIVMLLMGLLGFGKRTAFQAGLTVAQISEFSLILLSLGLGRGHIAPEVLSMGTLVGLVTILGSSYMILYSEAIYKRIGARIPYYRRGIHRHEHRKGHTRGDYDAIIFGCDRIGTAVTEHLKEAGKRYLIVDFNPHQVLELQGRGVPAVFGDADDIELYDELPLSTAELVLSTVPDPDTSALLIDTVRKRNDEARIIVTAEQPDEALMLYDRGADYVIVPHLVGGAHATGMVEMLFTDLSGFLDRKQGHVEQLKSRKRS